MAFVVKIFRFLLLLKAKKAKRADVGIRLPLTVGNLLLYFSFYVSFKPTVISVCYKCTTVLHLSLRVIPVV